MRRVVKTAIFGIGAIGAIALVWQCLLCWPEFRPSNPARYQDNTDYSSNGYPNVDTSLVNAETWRPKAAETKMSHCVGWLAEKFDCHFTIEEDSKSPYGGFYHQKVDYSFSAKDLDSGLAELGRQAPSYRMERDKKNRAVVHIVARSLRDSVFDKRINLRFSGIANVLLRKKLKKYQIEEEIASTGAMAFFDMTKLKIDAIDETMRVAITDCIPLSEYSRILWHSRVVRQDGKVTTYVEYRYTSWMFTGYGNSRFTLRDGLTKFFGCDPKATYSQLFEDQVKFEPAQPYHAEIGQKAMNFVEQKAKSDNSANVRWAMFYLGKHKDSKGIPVLLKHIDYKYTTCGILEESYPALKALRLMGEAATEPTLKELLKEKTDLRSQLLCRALIAIEGREKTAKMLNKELRALRDEAQIKRLKATMEHCDFDVE